MFILYPLSGRLLLEPVDDSSSCLSIYIRSYPYNSISIHKEPRPLSSTQNLSGRCINVDAIYGIFHLNKGYYLAVATRSEVVGFAPNGAEIKKVLAIDVLQIPSEATTASQMIDDDDAEYLHYLRLALDQPSFYFCHGYDLTNTCQRLSDFEATQQAQASDAKGSRKGQPDNRFFFNYPHISHFLAHSPPSTPAGSPQVGKDNEPSPGTSQAQEDLSQYIHPMIHGLVRYDSNVEAGGATFSMLLISRRGRFNIGTRFNVRGVDANGHAANFVETEQVIFSMSNASLYSFVQIRGSIPTIWEQKVTLKYMPRAKILAAEDAREARFVKHFVSGDSDPVAHYGGSKCLCINLIDRVGKSKTVADQRALGEEYSKLVEAFRMKNSSHGVDLQLVWFDFHYECRKMRWDKLSGLIDMIHSELDKDIGFFATDEAGKVIRKQKGVVRTNCMDNLDRTNVVQCVVARRAALAAIKGLGGKDVQPPPDPKKKNSGPDVLNSAYSGFEKIFKGAWGDNADIISINYSGTPALKTDFTRTGKRTYHGLVQDGINSVQRYFLNNFYDGEKQDALDLLQGEVAGSSELGEMGLLAMKRSKRRNKETIGGVLTKILLIFILCNAIGQWLYPEDPVLAGSGMAVLVLAFIAHRVLKPGISAERAKYFIDEPMIRAAAHPKKM